MKKLFERLVGGPAPPAAPAAAEADDPSFFATVFQERPQDDASDAAADPRSRLRGVSRPCDALRGLALLEQAWQRDRWMRPLDGGQRLRLASALEFVTVEAGHEVITQDEPGDYAIIVLEGVLAVDRMQPWGARARLAEARQGDVLGELSLVDGGTRFGSCMTLSRCTLAIIDTVRLERLARQDPGLAFALLACMTRRLALRMRQLSARLAALLGSA